MIHFIVFVSFSDNFDNTMTMSCTLISDLFVFEKPVIQCSSFSNFPFNEDHPSLLGTTWHVCERLLVAGVHHAMNVPINQHQSYMVVGAYICRIFFKTRGWFKIWCIRGGEMPWSSAYRADLSDKQASKKGKKCFVTAGKGTVLSGNIVYRKPGWLWTPGWLSTSKEKSFCFIYYLLLLKFSKIILIYCISCYFREGFIFANFASQTLAKISKFMSIYSNDMKNREINHSRICKSPKTRK